VLRLNFRGEIELFQKLFRTIGRAICHKEIESKLINMKHRLPLIAFALLLAGCTTRSISDSDYQNPYGWRRPANPYYKGELTELDILGAAPKQEATTLNIAKALEEASTPKMRRGDKLILIQSGASVPDHQMVEEASRYYSVAPFSGVPPTDNQGMAESLRLRAAQGGFRFVLCYWGVLESAQEDKEGRVVSWVPIVGAFVPDQKQKMRIRLRALLLDVASGGWKMFTPQTQDDSGYNSRVSRESSDQKLVESLKERGYKTLVADLLKE
jgi:hypothetical protein